MVKLISLSYLEILDAYGGLVYVVDLKLTLLNRSSRLSVGLELTTLLLNSLSGCSLNRCLGLTTSGVWLLLLGLFGVLY